MQGHQSNHSDPASQLAALQPYLASTAIVNAAHPDIQNYARARSAGHSDAGSKAIALYYAVRDEIRYDPYSIDFSTEGLCASNTLESKHGWCVTKAVLLAACCRSVNIPARLGFADVKNHLSTANLRASMGTNLFYWHGYTSILINEKWLKATPAFNIELCEKFRIRSLEFNGEEDSIYHPYDMDGRQHMEYVNFRGEFADVPVAEMAADFRKYYPNMSLNFSHRDFDAEVEQETR